MTLKFSRTWSRKRSQNPELPCLKHGIGQAGPELKDTKEHTRTVAQHTQDQPVCNPKIV